MEGVLFPVLTGVDTLHAPTSSKKNTGTLLYAHAFLELCDSLMYEGQEDPQLWRLCTRVLAEAAQAGEKDFGVVYEKWLWNLLATLGLCPVLQEQKRTSSLLNQLFQEYCNVQPFAWLTAYNLQPTASIRSSDVAGLAKEDNLNLWY